MITTHSSNRKSLKIFEKKYRVQKLGKAFEGNESKTGLTFHTNL